jgi:hypothetical protein
LRNGCIWPRVGTIYENVSEFDAERNVFEYEVKEVIRGLRNYIMRSFVICFVQQI